MKDFHNKVAIITGAASGIGKAIAESCIKRDMKVQDSKIHYLINNAGIITPIGPLQPLNKKKLVEEKNPPVKVSNFSLTSKPKKRHHALVEDECAITQVAVLNKSIERNLSHGRCHRNIRIYEGNI